MAKKCYKFLETTQASDGGKNMKLEKFKEKDKKKVGVIVFTIVCVLLISGVILYRTFAIFEVKTNQNIIKGSVEGMGDLEFAFYINDTIVKDAPSKENKTSYVFDEENSSCTNDAHVYWDYQQWGPMVTDITKTKTKCYLKFKTEYSEEILNGAVPELKGELTPVILEDDGTVKRADITKQWYSYGSQKWANAVITGNSYELLGSNVHGEPTKGEDYVHLDDDDYIDLGLANQEFSNQLTAVIKLKMNKVNQYQFLLGNAERVGFGVEWLVEQAIRVGITGSSSLSVKCQISTPQDYHTYILRFDGNNLKLYLDGIECASQNLESNISSSQMPIIIGGNPEVSDNGYKIGETDKAYIDVKQAAIFNRAIDEEEIKAISTENFKITNGEGLLKYVDFTNKTYESGEVISEDNIESYFVWIPRYKYQIWNGEEETKEFTSVQSLGQINNAAEQTELNQQKEIKIEFENKHMPISNGTLKNEWLTHPAFTSFDSNGFWVGKFETGYKGATKTTDAEKNSQEPSKIIIKPNVYSWRNINVSNAFETSKAYKSTLDSHMMKNMEWGAVAYLTNSQYGRCPGGSCTEVRINNSENYVTGSSAKNAPTCGYTNDNQDCNKYGENTPNIDNDDTLNYKNSQSVISSTTNNYYGIYDMAGGAWEYVMGVMRSGRNDDSPTSGRSSTYNSGFNGKFTCPTCDETGKPESLTDGKAWPSSEYYDLYDYQTTDQEYQKGILGDGTKEFGSFYQVFFGTQKRRVSGWNADSAFFVYNRSPWFRRGGDFTDGTEAGVGSFDDADGDAYDVLSFRVVLTF